MIKKQLGILAGAVLLASSANAEFTLSDNPLAGFPNDTCGGFSCFTGTDGDLFFWATDSNNVAGTVFVNLDQFGITVDSLMSGASFTQNLGVSLAGYDQWGILGASSDLETSYSYGKAGVALGTLFASTNAPLGTTGLGEGSVDGLVSTVNNWSTDINTALAGADSGSVTAADAANRDSDPNRGGSQYAGNGFGDVANLWFYGILDTTPEGNFSGTEPADSNIDTVSSITQITGTASIVGGSLVVSAVPVPAAAWLFGSALLGLGVVRRKS